MRFFSAVFFLITLHVSLISQNNESPQINWMTWNEAIEANKLDQKKIYVDIYTSWCGFCKKMDQSTFQDPDVINMLNEHFYAIKFDAEQKNPIDFMGHTFEYESLSGTRGVHMLAYSLTAGELAYPTFIMLDEDIARIRVSPGFKDTKEVLKELEFVVKEKYKSQSFEDYNKS